MVADMVRNVNFAPMAREQSLVAIESASDNSNGLMLINREGIEQHWGVACVSNDTYHIKNSFSELCTGDVNQDYNTSYQGDSSYFSDANSESNSSIFEKRLHMDAELTMVKSDGRAYTGCIEKRVLDVAKIAIPTNKQQGANETTDIGDSKPDVLFQTELPAIEDDASAIARNDKKLQNQEGNNQNWLAMCSKGLKYLIVGDSQPCDGGKVQLLVSCNVHITIETPELNRRYSFKLFKVIEQDQPLAKCLNSNMSRKSLLFETNGNR